MKEIPDALGFLLGEAIVRLRKVHYKVGGRVRKEGGDYSYEGEVVGVIKKRSGKVRYVVENDDGLLFIFNEKQLKPCR